MKALSLILACTLGYSISSPIYLVAQDIRVPARPAGQQHSATVSLDRFECLNADEDEGFSDGDEPYLWVVYFKIDGQTVDLTATPASLSSTTYSPHRVIRDHRTGERQRIGSHGNLGRRHIECWTKFAIPETLGRYSTTLRPIEVPPELMTEAGRKRATLVGVAVVAMEEDALSEEVAEAGRVQFTRTLQEELDSAIRAMNANPDPEAMAENITRQVRRRMREETLHRWWENLGAIIPIVGDPDDVIGFDFAITSYAALETAEQIPFILEMTTTEGTELKAGYRIFGAFGSSFARVPQPVPVTVSFLSVKLADPAEPGRQAMARFSFRVLSGQEERHLRYPASDLLDLPLDQVHPLPAAMRVSLPATASSLRIMVSITDESKKRTEVLPHPATGRLLRIDKPLVISIQETYDRREGYGNGVHTARATGAGGESLEVTYRIDARPLGVRPIRRPFQEGVPQIRPTRDPPDQAGGPIGKTDYLAAAAEAQSLSFTKVRTYPKDRELTNEGADSEAAQGIAFDGSHWFYATASHVYRLLWGFGSSDR